LSSALAATVISTIATVAGPRVLGLLVDSAVAPKDSTALKSFVVLYVVLEVVRLVSSGFHSYLFQALGQRTLQDLRVRMLGHVLRLPAARLDSVSSGALGTRLVADVGALSALFTSGFVRVVERILTALFIITSIFLLEPRLGLFCVLFFLIFALFSAVVSRKLYVAYSRIRETLAEVNSFMTESVAGLRALHLFNREHAQTAAFGNLSATLARWRMHPAMLFGALHACMTLVVGASMCTLIWYGGGLVQAGELSVGALVAIISYVLWLFWPIMTVVNEWNTFLAAMAAAERVFELLDWPVESAEGEHAPLTRQATSESPSIALENVWFGYHPDSWVLKDLTLEILPGQKVAICGPTGSGKSTLLSLLTRFYDPVRGTIFLGGEPLGNLPRQQVRSRLGIVQQDVFLFSGTLKENITLWDERVEAPPQNSDFRVRFDLEMKIYERGANLSVGERQYLAFLRTVARSPEVWLVDEATSYLDPQLDRELMRRLHAAARGKTVIVVAHRLASIVDSDLIVVLEQGRILEQGTHLELMEQGGLYAKMFQLQAVYEEQREEA
jgi:ATP-binding cassette subfamily B protein